MSKIFVRERRRVGRGEAKPRFVVVAVEGADLPRPASHENHAPTEAVEDLIGDLQQALH